MLDLLPAAAHAAPGPYLGFALQPVRLCYHLLTAADETYASIEYADDVAVGWPDGSYLLEQTKSALKHNPLADWSPDLWKTLSNWLGGIETGSIDPSRTTFQLYVTPSHDGPLARALNEARTQDSVDAFVFLVRQRLAQLKKPPKSSNFVKRFLAANANNRTALIMNTVIVASDDDPVEPLRRLVAPTVAPEMVDVICHAAIGFAKEQADKLLRAHRPAILNAGAFKAAFRTFVQKNNLPGLLRSFTGPPSAIDVELTLNEQPRFIRQLQIIDIEYDDQLRAVSDFLRASADRTKWSELGLLFESDLEKWNGTLHRKHVATKGEVEDLHAQLDPRVRGRVVFRRCCSADVRLDGREVPGHFVSGSFHSLADGMQIGWHPDYVELLKTIDP